LELTECKGKHVEVNTTKRATIFRIGIYSRRSSSRTDYCDGGIVMPTYTYELGDSSSYPDLAYNEVITNTKVYDTTVGLPLVNADTYDFVGFQKVVIETVFIDMGMANRKPASAYHGALAPANYAPAVVVRKYVPYVPYVKPDLGVSNESRVDRSLTSKSKTRGKSKSYKPKQGARCATGYRKINGMCVKQ